MLRIGKVLDDCFGGDELAVSLVLVVSYVLSGRVVARQRRMLRGEFASHSRADSSELVEGIVFADEGSSSKALGSNHGFALWSMKAPSPPPNSVNFGV